MENFIFGLIFQFMPTKRPQNIKRTKQAKQINVPVFHITSYFPFVFWGAFRYILLSLRGNKNPLNYLIKMAPYIYRFNNWFGNENNVCEGNFKFFFWIVVNIFIVCPRGLPINLILHITLELRNILQLEDWPANSSIGYCPQIFKNWELPKWVQKFMPNFNYIQNIIKLEFWATMRAKFQYWDHWAVVFW